jgi:hypothetical protein
MILYAATAFASAFLLFLVQPLLAKYILPWFGGSPGVWTTCLLFFQVLLTAGYSYAHLLASRFTRRSQAAITIGFLLWTLTSLPISPARASGDISTPTWQILKLLFASIGICYFLLSSTAPLLQSWFSHRFRGVSPYRLYTLSNLGSLLAIVSYPLVIEPRLGLGIQTKFWSWLYVVFALLSGSCAMMLWRAGSRLKVNGRTLPTDSAMEPATSPKWPDRIMWMALTALSCAMLMATTNQLCQDVAVILFCGSSRWGLPAFIYTVFSQRTLVLRRGFGIALRRSGANLLCFEPGHLHLSADSNCLLLLYALRLLHGLPWRTNPP